MTDLEKRELIGVEIEGWHVAESNGYYQVQDASGRGISVYGWNKPRAHALNLDLPGYDHDLNACRGAELKLKKRGLLTVYFRQLRDLIVGRNALCDEADAEKIAIADASFRCHALAIVACGLREMHNHEVLDQS